MQKQSPDELGEVIEALMKGGVWDEHPKHLERYLTIKPWSRRKEERGTSYRIVKRILEEKYPEILGKLDLQRLFTEDLASMGALLVIMALVGRPFGSTFLVGASATVSTVIWPAYNPNI
jgi:hypothetical protein